MKYITSILILLSGFFTTAAAAESAASVLEKATAKINAAQSVTADYIISSGSASEKGRLILSSGRFSLSSKSLNTWYDGITLWTYSPSLKEVNITNPTADELMEINPFAIINNYSTYYTPALLSSSKTEYKLAMTPKKKGSAISKAILTVNAASYYPENITLTMPDNSTVNIKIESITSGKAIPANAFKFDRKAAPDAEIIDLR